MRRLSIDRVFSFTTAAVLIAAGNAHAQLAADSRYNGLSRPIRVSVVLPEGFTGEPSLMLLRAGNDPAAASTVPAEVGTVDLAGLFPTLWTTNEPAVMYAQLVLEGVSIGAPLVLEPMLTPVGAQSGFVRALVDAAEGRDEKTLNTLARLTSASRIGMKNKVELHDRAARVFSGYRIREKRDVILDTEFGTLRIATRPEHAPRASAHFVELADGGFYNGVVFHRIVNDNGRGEPFVIQSGDPTGLGRGGSGAHIDFEASALPHDFGTLSIARHPYDPNTNGSQFFICLSRAGCADLDGLYTSFAEVVEGAGVIEGIRLLDMVMREEEDGSLTPTDRPIEPPTIRRAYTVPSPPVDQFRPRVSQEDLATPVER